MNTIIPDQQAIQFDIARTEEDLHQILSLQKLNLKNEISDETKKEQGFLTVNHKIEELILMQQSTPQIVARANGRIVAFALGMLPELGKLISDLQPMFTLLEGLNWHSVKLPAYRYYIMGQVCVDVNFRGQGVFDQLYQKHKEVYSTEYDLCITEISTSNTRSQRAHERVGFETIHTHLDHVDEWNVVVWEF
ncbi:GNAT family N-acetyltransferase [Dyadobacter sp. NIV53]|uniref:GNAT family N-acetyltransferase n=1 Tax=Dyadobacter sp. NIV53 TaxID=2861765 RepID=UPI001C88D585|nr:GNAT family N-acetyltransferase [Dyadobacter sp. NIV53]